MKSKKLTIITPKNYSNPGLREHMYNAVDAVMNDENKPLGYAFVTFHENGCFHAYYDCPAGVASIDIPEMTKARLQAKIIKNLEGYE